MRTEWLETSEMNNDYSTIEGVRSEERKGGNAMEGAIEVRNWRERRELVT